MEEENKDKVVEPICKCGHGIHKHLYGVHRCVMQDCDCMQFEKYDEPLSTTH